MNRTSFAVCLALTLPAAAFAGPGDHHEMGKDRRALEDDLRDEQFATALLREFDRAVAARDNRAITAAEERASKALRDELAEALRETGQAAGGYKRSEQEVDSDARRGDRREFHDDRRDAMKDRHDLMDKSEYQQRIQTLNEEWVRIRPLRGPKWMQRKHGILVELVELSRREIRADMSEVHEDRGERREDREERHEEHRERGW